MIHDSLVLLFLSPCVSLPLFLSANSASTPTVEKIEQLKMDNVFWMAAQLDKMTNSTFIDTVEILGDIPDYKADQLAVLKKKATEVKDSWTAWFTKMRLLLD